MPTVAASSDPDKRMSAIRIVGSDRCATAVTLLLLPLVKALLEGNMRRTIEQIDLQNIAEDMNAFAVITVGPRWTIEFEGEKRSLFVERRMEGQEPELLRIDGMKVTSYLDGTASLR